MHWLSASIQSRIETLAALKVQIEQARETLAEIEETSWGVTLREIDGERFVVLPDGTLDDPPWTVGGRPALKLSSEGGSCMTGLERQLMTALRTLSAESRTERRQHAEEQQRHSEDVEALRQRFERQAAENETLRRQFERLDGQNDTIGPGLQDARRDVARALDVMRQRAPARDRDHGPSR